MKINLILFSSELNDRSNVMEARSYLFDSLRAFYDINIINAGNYTSIIELSGQDVKENDLTLLFIGSGGTEEMFLNIFPFLKQPIVIISDGYYNSFAAAFEICTWLENNNIEYVNFNVPIDAKEHYFKELCNNLNRLYKHILTKNELRGERIGLIGGSSSWLISSHIDKDIISSKFGVIFIDIRTTELSDLYFSIKNEKRDFSNDPLINKYKNLLIDKRTTEDLINAIIIYYAIKEICTKYSLSSITVKCFDLIKLCNTTSCLALAILNDNGIISGCEGDIPSLVTMIMLKKGDNKLGFMVNPTSSDRDNLTVDFSHCTIPLTMTESFKLSSHFESNLGIGVSGILPIGKYSIFKIGGKNLDKYFYCTGSIISNPNLPMRCRTQIRFKFNSKENFDLFISSRLGNHVIIFKEGVID